MLIFTLKTVTISTINIVDRGNLGVISNPAFYDKLETFVCYLYNNNNKQATMFIVARLATQQISVFADWSQFPNNIYLPK